MQNSIVCCRWASDLFKSINLKITIPISLVLTLLGILAMGNLLQVSLPKELVITSLVFGGLGLIVSLVLFCIRTSKFNDGDNGLPGSLPPPSYMPGPVSSLPATGYSPSEPSNPSAMASMPACSFPGSSSLDPVLSNTLPTTSRSSDPAHTEASLSPSCGLSECSSDPVIVPPSHSLSASSQSRSDSISLETSETNPASGPDSGSLDPLAPSIGPLTAPHSGPQEGRSILQEMSFRNSFEHAMFYYDLASRTQKFMRGDPVQCDKFKKILEFRHQRLRFHYPSGATFLLDCSMELARLSGKKIDIEVTELTAADFDSHPEWLESFCQAFQEAFDINPRGGGVFFPHKILEILRDPLEKLYVGRNKSNPDEIFGGLFVRTEKDGSLFMHSLCRRACATKIHLTEAVKKFIEDLAEHREKTVVRCEVLLNNKAAFDIYRKFGFTIETQNAKQYTLILRR